MGKRYQPVLLHSSLLTGRPQGFLICQGCLCTLHEDFSVLPVGSEEDRGCFEGLMV
jgi:hypothetical protein